MSLRALLEGKAARTVTVPVQVVDPGPARDAEQAASRAMLLAQLAATGGDEGKLAELAAARAEQEQAQAALAACYVQVRFAALPSQHMERLAAAHTLAGGELDEHAILPQLAAACALDPDLQDPDWWAIQLAAPAWSQGELADLFRRLLDLNWQLPPEGLPKG